jgi:hypothetical protein
MIAKRVGKGLHNFLELHDLEDELRIQIGVVICDDGYKEAQEILDDVNFARAFVKSQPDAGHWVYTRKEIQQMRKTQGI